MVHLLDNRIGADNGNGVTDIKRQELVLAP